jgi:SAM-dependent methyltransferase
MVPAAVAPYQFKAGPYSSHSLLLAALPAEGHGKRVLDVGCAGGYLGEILATRGYRVTGIDTPGIDPTAFPASIELLEADLDMALPILEGGFDFIICADVLEHLKRPDGLLGDLHQLLAANGRLIASLPNSGHAYFRWTVLRGRFPAQDRGLFDRTHLHFYTWDGWVDLFGRAGFRIQSVQQSGVPVGLAIPRWSDTALVRSCEWLSYQSARVWKKMFAYQFIVVASSEKRA